MVGLTDQKKVIKYLIARKREGFLLTQDARRQSVAVALVNIVVDYESHGKIIAVNTQALDKLSHPKEITSR